MWLVDAHDSIINPATFIVIHPLLLTVYLTNHQQGFVLPVAEFRKNYDPALSLDMLQITPERSKLFPYDFAYHLLLHLSIVCYF